MKFLVTLLIALVTFATADAAKVDIYKAALQNKIFTFKYKVNEFPIRSVNKKVATARNGNGGQTISSAVGMGALNSGGVIVTNNKDSYFENSYDAFTWIFQNANTKIGNYESKGEQSKHNVKAGGFSTLTKGDEKFQFWFEINDDGTKNFLFMTVGDLRKKLLKPIQTKSLKMLKNIQTPTKNFSKIIILEIQTFIKRCNRFCRPNKLY